MNDDDDRAAILARRKRFIAVALASLGGCAPQPATTVPSAEVPAAVPATPPPSAEPLIDSDGDGVPDRDDECPTIPAEDDSPEHPGCPPRACLNVVRG